METIGVRNTLHTMAFQDTSSSIVGVKEFTQMATPPCHLLALPAELRNQIYTLALTHTEPISVDELGRMVMPGLLGVCKQIRDEAKDILYASNEFHLAVDDDTPHDGLKFIEALTPSQRKHRSRTVLYFQPSRIVATNRPSVKELMDIHIPAALAAITAASTDEERKASERKCERQKLEVWMPWTVLIIKMVQAGVRPTKISCKPRIFINVNPSKWTTEMWWGNMMVEVIGTAKFPKGLEGMVKFVEDASKLLED